MNKNGNYFFILFFCILLFSTIVIAYVASPLRMASRDKIFLGEEDAEITIIEFGDYLDQNTSEMFPIIEEILDEFPNNSKFIFKSYPQTNDSVLATNGVKCARSKGKNWQLHKKLLSENLTSLSHSQLYDYAKELNIKISSLQNCVENNIYENTINQDIKIANRLKIKTFPTIFINSKRIEGIYNISEIREIINQK